MHDLVLIGQLLIMEMRLRFKKYDEMVNIKDLKPSPYQRNKHTKEQIERLARLMAEQGVRHPIHVSTQTNTICFGHGRLAAAKLNKWTNFPVVYQDFVSKDEEYACVQSDNAIALWAELDFPKINIDIQDMGPDFDVDLLGIKNFTVDVSEKYTQEVKVPEKNHLENYKKEDLDHECPECGFTWTD